MTGSDQPGIDRLMIGKVAPIGFGRVNDRHMLADPAGESQIFRPPQFVAGFPEEVNDVTGTFDIHGHRFSGVINFADNREEEGRGDGDLHRTVVEIVLHGVLAGDQRQVVDHADVVERLVGTDQLGHLVVAVRGFFGEHRIAPAEVVETGNQVEGTADRHIIAERLVNGIGGHVVGIDVGVARADAVSRHHPFERFENRPDYRGIGRAVIADTGERLDH